MTQLIMVWTLVFSGVNSGAYTLYYPTQTACLSAKAELNSKQGFEQDSNRHVCIKSYLGRSGK